jgi:flagellar hook-basal body complex protein FliE
MPISPTTAVDPAFSITGPEWQMPAVDQTAPAPAGGGGFGGMLGQAMSGLAATQAEAAAGAQALATGQASDPTAVVMAVERARLSMQLAAQVRTKSVEAIQDIFHTQV